MTKATVLAESRLPASCPLRRPDAMNAFAKAIRAGSILSLETQNFLLEQPESARVAWLGQLMESSRNVFQPWSMEILFATGVQSQVRFGQLQELLGISSRTLSQKLRGLTDASLLARHVEPGPPTRVHYELTKQGRATVAAASPLFAQLNLASLGLGLDGRPLPES